MEKNIPSSLPVIKSYEISLHALVTIECQDLASKFEENAKKDLARMMDLNENNSQVESDNNKLKDEIINLKVEVSKRRKGECNTTPLEASILEQ